MVSPPQQDVADSLTFQWKLLMSRLGMCIFQRVGRLGLKFASLNWMSFCFYALSNFIVGLISQTILARLSSALMREWKREKTAGVEIWTWAPNRIRPGVCSLHDNDLWLRDHVGFQTVRTVANSDSEREKERRGEIWSEWMISHLLSTFHQQFERNQTKPPQRVIDFERTTQLK